MTDTPQTPPIATVQMLRHTAVDAPKGVEHADVEYDDVHPDQQHRLGTIHEVTEKDLQTTRWNGPA